MNVAELQKVQSEILAQGGSHLGTLLWWSLSNNRVHHAALEDLARNHGLDPKYLPSPVKPVNAFRRAWRHANTRLSQGLMLRQIADTNDSIVVGLVEERANTAVMDLNYTTQAKITFDKLTESLSCYALHDIYAKVSELYQHHLAHTTQDIRFILSAFVRESGVSLRQQGGTYFIPASSQATLDALSAVVKEAGSNQVFQLPIYDSPQVKSTLTTVARETLDEEICSLRDELESFDDKTRDSTLEKRIARFDELRSRVALFSGVLSFSADGLSTKITDVQNALRAKLGLPITLPTTAEAQLTISKSRDSLPLALEPVQLVVAADDSAGF